VIIASFNNQHTYGQFSEGKIWWKLLL